MVFLNPTCQDQLHISLTQSRFSSSSSVNSSFNSSSFSKQQKFFHFKKECRSLPKTGEPNGWADRGRDVVRARLKVNPFVARTRGWSGRRNNGNNNKNQPSAAVPPWPVPHTVTCIRRSGKPLTLIHPCYRTHDKTQLFDYFLARKIANTLQVFIFSFDLL